MANLTHGDSSWSSGTLTQTAQSRTYTFATADKYVDKDIALTVKAQDGSGSIIGGALSHSEITTDDTTYLQDASSGGVGPITFTNTASRAAATYKVGTAGWVDNASDVTALGASSTDTKTVTKYIKEGSAAVKGSQSISTSGSITANGGTLTATLSGSKSIAATVSKAGWISSVSSASVSASGTATAQATDLDANLIAANIVKGKTIFGVTGDETGAVTTTFANTAAEGQEYTDISADAPILKSGDFLYINEGYTTNKKISLAKLVPDDATLTASTGAAYILSGQSAYDKDGKLIVGTIPNATVTSGTATLASSSVGALNTSTNKYPMTVKVNVSAPTVGTGGYITSSVGTKNPKDGQSITVNLDKAVCTVEGGGLTAGAGSSSINVNGYYDGTNVSSTDKIALATTAAAGYYKIGTTGKGTVSRAAITDAHTAGWLEAKSAANVSAATSLSSNSGTSTYYVKKSTTGTAATFTPESSQTYNFTPSDSAQKLVISAGYYPSDREITVKKIDYAVATQGTISAADGSISSVTASAGTPTVDLKNYKYNVPLTLSASGTSWAKVTKNGYVDSSDNTSKALSGSGSATVTLDVDNGAYTVA